MDPHAARAQLPAVEHQVVGLGADTGQLDGIGGVEQRPVVGVGHGERVVRRAPGGRRRPARTRTAGSRRPTGTAARPRSPAGGRARGAAARARGRWWSSSSATSSRRSPVRGARWRPPGRPARPRTGTWRPARSSPPPSSTCIQTRPLAPQRLARSVRSSSCLRVRSAAARRPGCPSPLGALKALNPVSANTSVSSTSSIPKRRSGLSRAEPVHGLAPGHALEGRRAARR